MNEVITFTDYNNFKFALDIEIKETVNSFVRIGYLLKVARDTKILEESGYKSVAEFALAEYNLGKDAVSRFIAINDKYSQNGYSAELEDKYKAYGLAKLQEMLTLPEPVADLLAPQMTRTQIQEVKKEVKEEEQITDLEVMMEQVDTSMDDLTYPLERFWYAYIRDNPKTYKALCKLKLYAKEQDSSQRMKEIMEVLAPSGAAIMTVRIPKEGQWMLAIKGAEQDVELLRTRTGERFYMSNGDMVEIVNRWCLSDQYCKEIWESMFNMEFEQTEIPNAAVAQQEEPKKAAEEQKKETEVEKPQAAESIEEEKAEEITTEIEQEEVKEKENVINTGCEVNLNPPVEAEKPEESQEEQEAVQQSFIEPEPVEEEEEKEDEQAAGYGEELKQQTKKSFQAEALNESFSLSEALIREDYRKAQSLCRNVLDTVSQILEMEEQENE